MKYITKLFLSGLMIICAGMVIYSLEYRGKEFKHDPVDDRYMRVEAKNWYRSSERKNHRGVDLLAPGGAKVYSVEDGEVVDMRENPPDEIMQAIKELNKKIEEARKKNNKEVMIEARKELQKITDEYKDRYSIPGSGYKGYGNVVLIKHNRNDGSGNFYTLYAHLQSINVNIGDTVKAGDIIGKADDTGDSDGNHLHFESRLGDPFSERLITTPIPPYPYDPENPDDTIELEEEVEIIEEDGGGGGGSDGDDGEDSWDDEEDGIPPGGPGGGGLGGGSPGGGGGGARGNPGNDNPDENESFSSSFTLDPKDPKNPLLQNCSKERENPSPSSLEL